MLGIPLSNSQYNLLGMRGMKFNCCAMFYLYVQTSTLKLFSAEAAASSLKKKVNLTCLTKFDSDCQTSTNNQINFVEIQMS